MKSVHLFFLLSANDDMSWSNNRRRSLLVLFSVLIDTLCYRRVLWPWILSRSLFFTGVEGGRGKGH